MAQSTFQQQVHKFPSRGLPGDKAALSAHIYTERTYIAGDAAVVAGNFVWDDPRNSSSGGVLFRALSSSSDAARPLGIVERNLGYAIADGRDGGSLSIPERGRLNTVVRGHLFAVSGTAATKGHKVFANLADGSIKTAKAGASVPGAVETNWSVMESGAAGDIITISNWSAS